MQRSVLAGWLQRATCDQTSNNKKSGQIIPAARESVNASCLGQADRECY
jgi:hypothetical protein